MLKIIFDTFLHTLTITAFVLSMMLLIEYLTVRTQDRFLNFIKINKWGQVVIAALLGIIPGCLGTFLAVSLYVHKILNFPALVTVMIATSGDEAFVMFGEFPKTAFLINIGLFAVAIITGFVLNLFLKEKNFIKLNKNLLKTHNIPQCICFDKKQFKHDWKNLSLSRFLLVTFALFGLIFFSLKSIITNDWNFKHVTLILIFAFLLFVVVTVPEHFLEKHLWAHTIKKHLLKIFLWTFGTLLIINLLLPYFNISVENFRTIAQKYYWLMLLFAILVGIIPESGPNLVFVFLFANGYIPISILTANSIVQDGHGSLPLLAESRKSFFTTKAINMLVGFIVGAGLYLIGY